ncbi:MAG: hypothetical protein L0Y72_21930 [Gemmataceae bacterium]|nr:hypothetical protein [Gemmataceae bacterium]
MRIELSLHWTRKLAAEPAGLSLARETGAVLSWDQDNRLFLLDANGQIQAQTVFPETLAHAAISDDGAAVVAIGSNGLVRRLNLDFTVHWEKTWPAPLLAVALDPFGHWLALATGQGEVLLADARSAAQSQFVRKISCPRPLRQLAFVPTSLLLAGCADFGLAGMFDHTGAWKWRDAPVVHLGGLSVSGDGSVLLLACFSEGVYRYDRSGRAQKRLATPKPCRLVAQSFDDSLIVASGLENELWCFDAAGSLLQTAELEQPVTALALAGLGDSLYASHAGGVVRFALQRR